jgi:hypothetical protein
LPRAGDKGVVDGFAGSAHMDYCARTHMIIL